MQLPDSAVQQLWQLCWAMSMFDRGCQHPPLCKQQQVTWLPAMRHAELMIVGIGEVLMAAALPQDRAEATGRSALLLHVDLEAACRTKSASLQGSSGIAC